MKFILKFFAGIAILLLIVVGLWWMRESGGELTTRLGDSLDAKPIEKTTPTNPNQSSLQRAAIQQTNPAQYGSIVQAAAKANGVQVMRFVNNGPSQEVTLRWHGSVATKGGDVLDALLNAGHLADFETVGDPTVRNENGRKVFTATYSLFMK